MEAEGLSVSVAGRELVHDATFHIERGQRVALIGRNGAGKTTLLETLLGRRPAEHGRAKLGHGVSRSPTTRSSRWSCRSRRGWWTPSGTARS